MLARDEVLREAVPYESARRRRLVCLTPPAHCAYDPLDGEKFPPPLPPPATFC